MIDRVTMLTQLRRVVESAPEDLFDMSYVVRKTPCGTARCAFGWCLVDPWFLKNTRILDAVSLGPTHMNSYEATIQFNISYEDMCKLFNLECFSEVSKSAVIDNIDRLLAGKSAIAYSR